MYRGMIFDEKTLRKISRLTLVASQVRAGVLKGERRSTKRGSSLEFTDYRDYAPGDDLRRLDWNVYARSERPFIKLFEEEEDLAVHILVDASRSMDWGEGDQHKFHYALRLAASLGTIALSNGDQLQAAPLSARQKNSMVTNTFGPVRGQQNTLRFLQYLERLDPGGVTDLLRDLRAFSLHPHRPGILFVISDLFSESDALAGLAELQGRGFEVTLIHLLAPTELDPPLSGDLRLLDIETGAAQEVSIDAGMRTLYRQRVQAWQEEIGGRCRRRRIRYLPLSTGLPWDRAILQEMRRAGVLK